ncbi:hypothetical protein [Streptomyces sp. NPDC055006]
MLGNSVPAVPPGIDPDPFHHGTLGAVRSLGRTGVDVHVVAASQGSPVRRSGFVSAEHPPPGQDASLEEIGATPRRVSVSVAGAAVLIPMDDAGAIAVSPLREELLTRCGPARDAFVGSGFESRRPGFFLAGLMAAAGFGPSMRFVRGASSTAPHLAARGVRRSAAGVSWRDPHCPGARAAHGPPATADR